MANQINKQKAQQLLEKAESLQDQLNTALVHLVCEIAKGDPENANGFGLWAQGALDQFGDALAMLHGCIDEDGAL